MNGLRLSLLPLLAVAISLLPAATLHAQERGNPDFYVRLVPYLWLSNIDGYQELGNSEVRAFLTSEKLGTDWAGRVEVGKGRLRGIFEVSRGNLKSDLAAGDNPPWLRGPFVVTLTSFEILGAYELGSPETTGAVEILAGFRHTEHELALRLTEPPLEADFNASWTDPVVGIRYFTTLGGPFWFTVRSDIGGFDVGSKFTWTLEGEVGIEVFKYLDLTMRYLYREVEYDNGKTGDDRYLWDEGQTQGWLFGAMFKW